MSTTPLPLNIAVIAKKGGVGKSNLSLLLYEALKQANRSVELKDWDVQGTSTKALTFIYGKNEPPVKPAIIIWDTPPTIDNPVVATAVRASHTVLVVTTPNTADIWEAEEAVKYAQARNPNAIVRVVFNKVRKATIFGRLVDQNAETLSAPTLYSLAYRESYAHAISQGWKALDSAARQEFLQFALAVLSLKN